MKYTVYCGSYGNEGIYRCDFENGILAEPMKISDLGGTKYLATGEDNIITLFKENGKSGVAVLNRNGDLITSLAYEDIVSCFVGCLDNTVYTANFHEGTFSFLNYENDVLALSKKVKIRDKAGCHMVLPWHDCFLGFALYMDCIYVFNKEYECVNEIVFPEGTGPRHGVISDNEEYLYVVSELSREVFIIKAGTWEILDKVCLSDDENSSSAAIRLYENTLYVSVRGEDRVYEIKVNGEKLEVINSYFSGGKHPRDMIVLEGYVLCANTHSNVLSCVNEKGIVSEVEIPEAVAIAVI